MSKDAEEVQLLAAMAYGEASYRFNSYEEMSGIASVLLRQRNARGYSSMQNFVKAEPTFSFVVKDGSPRYAALMALDEKQAETALADIKSRHATTREMIKKLEPETAAETNPKTKQSKLAELEKLKKKNQSQAKQTLDAEAFVTAYKAAHNALDGGTDYSNGAFFWDGADIKTNYKNHFKVRHGIKIMDPSHNIYDLKDSIRLVIINKNVVKKDAAGKKTTIVTEVGRYDHIYESTAAQGGTIFWKHNPEYMSLVKAKEYK